MPVNDPNNPIDARYINTDGDAMAGPLLLETPASDLAAVTKIYVDRLLASVTGIIPGLLRRDGSLPMTGPLTLSGAPLNADHAARRAYVDAVMTYAQALAAAMLRHDGTVAMTGLLTLSGAPVNPAHAATKAYVDGLPVGLSTYDAVVAAAGGDYTSVVAACAGEAAGAKIFIKSGTYNEAANIQMQDGQMLIGENPEDTIIDFGAANRKVTFVGGVTNLMVRDLTLQNSIANYVVDMSGNYATVHNCRIFGLVAGFSGVRFAGQQCILSDNYIDGFSKVNEHGAVLGQYSKVYGNTFNDCSRGFSGGSNYLLAENIFLNIGLRQGLIGAGSVLNANFFGGGVQLDINGADVTISGNFINGAGGIVFGGDYDNVAITGNIFDGSMVMCNQTTVSDVTIAGNVFKGGSGVNFRGFNSVISGNAFQGAAFISLHANSHDLCVTGNNLNSSTAVPKILDSGTANTAKNNAGMDLQSEKAFSRMENTSGGPLVAGDCVVLKAVAAGDEVDTTVAQGDDLIFGMLDENIANAAHGAIQTEGKTAKLKCNGVVAIAIGDLLGTFAGAGIAMKAAAGDMAFAVALEVYAGADSLGVIDAILIKPRKV